MPCCPPPRFPASTTSSTRTKPTACRTTSHASTKILDRHNFYDTETILELTHPATQRRTLLIQSEMDVVADGSDGDRMPTLDEYIYISDYYQPFTSYAWPKATKTPNPLSPGGRSV
jgi:hypothetical protein